MITVIGSINMDLASSLDRFPVQGETVFGKSFAMVPGGKGANQAVACAKLGKKVNFVGCVGSDTFGEKLISNLSGYGITTQTIEIVSNVKGIANILLHENDNRIVVVPGANSDVTTSHIDAHWDTISKSELVMMQLEIPKDTIAYALKRCNEARIPVMLNPAPAEHFSIEWVEKVQYLTPNESECQQIFNAPYVEIVKKYPNKLIVTLGSKGACYHDGKNLITVNSYPSQVVDTTGAGDTFNGALAYAITNGMELSDAVRFANIAASLSVEKFGAQGGMPTLETVMERIIL